MIFELGEVDSTNSSALTLLNAGEAAPFLVRAQAQAGGRGRGGKAWSSPPGNFYGTFVVRPPGTGGHPAQLSFVAAVALSNVLSHQGLATQLKWPNDVLVNGAKISGILLEMHGAHVLIGMGVNLVSHPAQPGYASTCLRDEGVAMTAQELGQALDRELTALMQIWGAQGFGPIREAWLARAYRLGQGLIVRLPGQSAIEGTFGGLDSDGALLLGTAEGPRTIHAGDVYFHAAGH